MLGRAADDQLEAAMAESLLAQQPAMPVAHGDQVSKAVAGPAPSAEEVLAELGQRKDAARKRLTLPWSKIAIGGAVALGAVAILAARRKGRKPAPAPAKKRTSPTYRVTGSVKLR